MQLIVQISQCLLSETAIHLFLILSAFFLTYFRILGKDYFWVIDDLAGIADFSEKWQKLHKKNPLNGEIRYYDQEGYANLQWPIFPEKKIDSYDLNGKQVKYLSFIKELGFPGNVYRFIRLHLGKRFQVIGKNVRGHEVYGFVQSPRRHHIISMAVQTLNLIMAYAFLCNILPHPVAFGATLLYAVSPLTTSSVAWISGYNYNFSMFFSLALLNVALTFPAPELKYVVVALLSFLSTITIYTGAFTCILLWFLGLKIEAIIAGVVGFGIVAWKGLEMKEYRIKAFKEQNMGNTTFFKPRKIIVMFKTLWYYMRMVFLPIKLGLYHPWGYFYEETIERMDRMAWLGIATFGSFVLACFSGIFAVQFGAIWFLAYFAIFSNAITAQQFIADRYVMVPSFGICIILSYFLYGTPFFWMLVGLYAMRTFLHLPTFKNEVDFYASNFLNFRKSEVALGNLGVAFISQGMTGAAVDTWMMATQINPHYDVPWYNLYSVFKGNERLQEARDFLKKCLDAKIVHFDKKWNEELVLLDAKIQAQKNPVTPTELFYHQAADHFKAGNTSLEKQALENFMKGDTAGLIPEMITQVKQRLVELDSFQLCNPVQEPTRPEVTGLNPVDKGAGLPPRTN